eukprot:scaffold333468_cov40-Prasinocladus_malaysianus.AAC.1
MSNGLLVLQTCHSSGRGLTIKSILTPSRKRWEHSSSGPVTFPLGSKQPSCRARAIVESLASVPWFLHLPGTARLLIVEQLVKQRAREEVWGMLPGGIWDDRLDFAFIGPELSPRALTLLEKYWIQEKNKGKTRSQ